MKPIHIDHADRPQVVLRQGLPSIPRSRARRVAERHAEAIALAFSVAVALAALAVFTRGVL